MELGFSVLEEFRKPPGFSLLPTPLCQHSSPEAEDRRGLRVDHLLAAAVHLPQELASFRVELEQAPSRTSATVIWTAYLCIETSFPRISAQTTVSWAKFFGTPPPIIKRPVVPALILISVSSLKSSPSRWRGALWGVSPGGGRGRSRRCCPRRRAEDRDIVLKRRLDEGFLLGRCAGSGSAPSPG